MNDHANALRQLIVEIRQRDRDPIEWLLDVFRSAGLAAEDLHALAETFNSAAARHGINVSATQHGRCSFCMKDSRDVRALVTSPNANICNECIENARRSIRSKSPIKRFLGG
jgi:hypothetical protein